MSASFWMARLTVPLPFVIRIPPGSMTGLPNARVAHEYPASIHRCTGAPGPGRHHGPGCLHPPAFYVAGAQRPGAQASRPDFAAGAFHWQPLTADYLGFGSVRRLCTGSAGLLHAKPLWLRTGTGPAGRAVTDPRTGPGGNRPAVCRAGRHLADG